jgi:hypothetical protein
MSDANPSGEQIDLFFVTFEKVVRDAIAVQRLEIVLRVLPEKLVEYLLTCLVSLDKLQS